VVPARRTEQQAADIHVHEQRDVVVAAPRGRFIHAQARDSGPVHLRSRFVHMVMENPPDPTVVLADQPGHRLVEGRSYNALERGAPRLQAEFKVDLAASRMEAWVAKAHAAVNLPALPAHLYTFDFTSLNLAWPHVLHPNRPVQVGVVDPDFEFMKTRFEPEGEQTGLPVSKGIATFTPSGEEIHGGVPCLRYAVGGAAFKEQTGTLWVDKARGHWVEFRLELVGRESMDAAQWEAFKASRVQRAKDLLRDFGDD
jgi:hypothetical protein